ncbi:MAG: hypothetical protein ACRD25_06055 [Terracidiphilus sp.]
MKPKWCAALNHAIAIAMVHGPSRGLERLRALDGDQRMSGHYRLDAVRAHLFEKLGDFEKAVEHYQAAAAATASLPEQNYLIAQAARLEETRKEPGHRQAHPQS